MLSVGGGAVDGNIITSHCVAAGVPFSFQVIVAVLEVIALTTIFVGLEHGGAGIQFTFATQPACCTKVSLQNLKVRQPLGLEDVIVTPCN